MKFGASSKVKSTCVYGGAPKGPQVKDLTVGVRTINSTFARGPVRVRCRGVARSNSTPATLMSSIDAA